MLEKIINAIKDWWETNIVSEYPYEEKGTLEDFLSKKERN